MTSRLPVMVVSALLLAVLTSGARATCERCSTYTVDGETRWSCLQANPGSSDCWLIGSACYTHADCCSTSDGCEHAPFFPRAAVEALRDVGVFLTDARHLLAAEPYEVGG